MRVVIAAIGSRGDVVPFGHLAAQFVARGHNVVLVTHEAYTTLADPAVRVVPVPSDPGTLLAGPAARAVRRADPRELNRTRDLFAEFVHSAQSPTREALEGADVLVASTFALAAVDEALRRGVPVVRAHMWPEYPGLGGPMPLLPYSGLLPGPLRRVARASLRRAEPYLGGLDGWWARGRLHLVARHPVGLTTATAGSLYAFSPRVVPDRPAGRAAVTGWWTGSGSAGGLDGDDAIGGPGGRDGAGGTTARRLSPDVARALADGDDWIYAGFGSMDQGDPAALLSRLGAACERAGVRAVVQVGGMRGRPHPRLWCVGEEPHDALFGQVRAVVHHGGAGTTGAALRAGVPSLVVPHFADQFYWGARVHALGTGPRPLPRALASQRRLARRIGAALDPAMARRAGLLARRLAEEDGCGVAVRRVEAWVTHAREAEPTGSRERPGGSGRSALP